ncbi:MAG: ABC transporter ATP-binding protein [Ruminococcus sp.]|nr:ABC transporter ATP-binding protein [Ruminococcus sp.]
MTLKGCDLTKEFIRETSGSNRFKAVDNVTLTLNGGELTVLMGRSGSGKTTLMNMLSGVLEPTSGSVLLDERDIYSLSDKDLSRLRNKTFGMIPQGQTAVSSLNVFENIMLPFFLYKDSTPQDEQYADELMKRLDISHLASAKPHELSGGELRRMAIARALVRRPGIIFADEPTGDLDDENTALVFDFLKQTAISGAAVMIVTHETDAGSYADTLFTMKAGKI